MVDNNNFRYSSSSQSLTIAGDPLTSYGINFGVAADIFIANNTGTDDLYILSSNSTYIGNADDSTYNIDMVDGQIIIYAATSTIISSPAVSVFGDLSLSGALNVIGTSTFSDNVGIGTTSPVEKLTVDGTIRATNLAGGATNLTTDANGNIIRDPSDARVKTNVTEITGALEQVLALRGVRYNWRDTERFGEQTEVGFIAQEVDLVGPEVVSKGGEYWSLNSKNLIAVVVEAIQEMWVTVTGHEERLDSLEAENALLRSRIENLEGAAPASGGGGNSNPSVPDNTPTDQTPEPPVEENQPPAEETVPDPLVEDPVSTPLPEEVVSLPNEGDAEIVSSE